MTISIQELKSIDAEFWDAYVDTHPKASLYHLYKWKNVIEKAYGHKGYYLAASKSSENSVESNEFSLNSTSAGKLYPQNLTTGEPSSRGFQSQSKFIVGVLPLFNLKHFFFCNSLISIPFFDLGGILADDEDTEKALFAEALKLGQKLSVDRIELRHFNPIPWLNQNKIVQPVKLSNTWTCTTKLHKVRMLLELPESSQILMKSFKSKLRSQVKKPLKEGLNSRLGGIELLADFYKVFSTNMRDLGSPVHSKKLILNVLEEFPDRGKIIMVYKDDIPLACSIILGFKNVLENPWSSALRKYSRLSPNMLLYWTMLEYGCNHDFTYFDFGRSSPNEGTYKFKEQWGAKPFSLQWHYITSAGKRIDEESSEKSKFEKAIHYWQKLPLSLTRILGPMIRKYIGL
jgi:FemAB-related protein (PEP-CTERM system-associated)